MRPIKNIVIVGGGTAGWIAAAVLVSQLDRKSCQVQLVESDEIGTIGVGESTIPPFLELLRSLNIEEKDFIQKTQASFKLGIEFTNWRVKGESYFHPFGSITAGMNEYNFYQMWLKSLKRGDKFALQDFSPSSQMAMHRRFVLPQMAERTPVSEARYALHLDAKLVANYLRTYAESRGVTRVEGKVVDVLASEGQRIEKITLDSGRNLEADFFIDCTGFHALLIEKALGAEYCDWSHYLPCDKAVTVQTESTGETVPFTRAIAEDSGWIWRIPLQHRTGNGYVYSSEFCDDDKAMETLLNAVDGKALTEPKVIPFKTGVRKEIWKGNCLSLGLASGFIEPLESTAIHLVVRGMVHFMRHYPDRDCDQPLVDEFNRRMRMDYEEIRDFIVLHYCLTERDDSPFWRWWRDMEWPQSLGYIVDYFKVQGSLPEAVDPLFSAVSWRSVCEGMGVRPSKYSQLIDDMNYDEARCHLQNYIASSHEFIKKLPSHDQFIRDNCPAEK